MSLNNGEAKKTEISFGNKATEELNALKCYMNEIKQYEVLSKEEEKRLFEAYNVGDELAKEKIIKCNLRLVVNIAKTFYPPSSFEFLDLIQEGNIGLLTAIESFNVTLGYKFSTYATRGIKQAIQRSIANKGATIRVPVHLLDTYRKIKRFEDVYLTKYGDMPDIEEIAAALNMKKEKIEKTKKNVPQMVSLNTCLNSDDPDAGALIDMLVSDEISNPAEIVEQNVVKNAINEIIDTLSERESCIIKSRFGIEDGTPRTLEEVGMEIGVTRERARQLEKKIMGTMKDSFLEMCLLDFLV